MSMNEFMTGSTERGGNRGANAYSYQANTSMPWGMVPYGKQLSTAGKAIDTGIKGVGGATAGSIIKGGAAIAGASVARTAATGAAARAGLMAAGAATGPVGWGITAASILAPFVLPHIPVVGAAVNKIPVVGGMLSPSKSKKGKSTVVVGAGQSPGNPNLSAGPTSHLSSGPAGNLSAAAPSPLSSQRYVSGRGFRK